MVIGNGALLNHVNRSPLNIVFGPPDDGNDHFKDNSHFMVMSNISKNEGRGS